MKLIALEHENPDARPLDFAPDLLAAEARRVYELQQAGVIREIHFRADRNEAVLILECDTLDDARAALDALPLVQAGLITFEIIPLKPYPGLARLFAAGSA
ncbi:MAG: muconolactone Delta-isomerase family protein [Anaerolineae bacterium]|nr:muconolactone Delta-isomerase family protein [Anaerolineae bacterium]